MRLDQALSRIANNIDANLGWQVATYYYRAGSLNADEYAMVTKFDRLDEAGVELSKREQQARRRINEKILNSLTALELYEYGIDVDALTIAENGWQHDYDPF